MMPQRIQRKRERGYRMPEGAVYIGRPTKWGNPFVVQRARSRRDGPLDMWAVTWAGQKLGRYDDKRVAAADAVDRFERAIREQRARTHYTPTLTEIRRELVGKDLACWCDLDWPCHADVLLRLAAGAS